MNYWAWGGKYIGSRAGDVLYSSRGTPIGRFFDEDIYSFEGNYIGEVKSHNRIIVNSQKKNRRKSVGCRPCSHCGTSYCDYCVYLMYAGSEDFCFEE